MRWKYVIVERMGVETPIIFPEWVNHDTIATHGVVSAGFVLFTANDKNWGTCYVSNEIEVSCSGESFTLKTKSRGKEDADLIQRMLKSSLD